ncbi:hypothetical protein DOTSEDRAFT_71634 [Dothistroma septosporum NZE10]|uniref:F-box domain-containing protein n=1 Tax=Dothistroma septosporum (strain NZE10 / CBS 128990) TaxID=675120 RepID=N1PLI1_DOTSN|nr:hypothetical protein DOTSEDRAFT_71634 [Dothistroma septosporum NZE10]
MVLSMPPLQNAVWERQHVAALIERIQSKLRPTSKRLPNPPLSATVASMQHPVHSYRTPVHFDAATGLTTPYSHPFIPRKRTADGRTAWTFWSSVSQQARKWQRGPCPLLSLPQELLDYIYEFCKDDSRINTQAIMEEYRGTTKAIIHNAPWLPLLKCSREVNRDYSDILWKHTTLKLIDYFVELNPLSTPPLHPVLLKNLTRLDTILLAVCDICELNMPHAHGCNVLSELQNHRAWLGQLTATIPNLKDLNIKFYVQWPGEHHARVLRHPRSPHPFDLASTLNLLMELQGFHRMEVHRYRAMQVQDGLDARKPQAECFDLYVVVSCGRDSWEWIKEGSEEHRRLERQWWLERQWKGVRAWTGGEEVSSSVGG